MKRQPICWIKIFFRDQTFFEIKRIRLNWAYTSNSNILRWLIETFSRRRQSTLEINTSTNLSLQQLRNYKIHSALTRVSLVKFGKKQFFRNIFYSQLKEIEKDFSLFTSEEKNIYLRSHESFREAASIMQHFSISLFQFLAQIEIKMFRGWFICDYLVFRSIIYNSLESLFFAKIITI